MGGLSKFGYGFAAGAVVGVILAAMVWLSLSLWGCAVW